MRKINLKINGRYVDFETQAKSGNDRENEYIFVGMPETYVNYSYGEVNIIEMSTLGLSTADNLMALRFYKKWLDEKSNRPCYLIMNYDERWMKSNSSKCDFIKSLNFDKVIVLYKFKYKSNDDLLELYSVKKQIDSLRFDTVLYISYMPFCSYDIKYNNLHSEANLPTKKYICDYINELEFKKILLKDTGFSDNCIDYLKVNAEIIYPMKDWINDIIKEAVVDGVENYFAFIDKSAEEKYIPYIEELNGKYFNLNDLSAEGIKKILSDHSEFKKEKVFLVKEYVACYNQELKWAVDKLHQADSYNNILLVSHMGMFESNPDEDSKNIGKAFREIYTSEDSGSMGGCMGNKRLFKVDVMKYVREFLKSN